MRTGLVRVGGDGGRPEVLLSGDIGRTADAAQQPASWRGRAIALDASEPHGIQQSGLGVKKGTKYSGRIVLAADAGVEVKVSLIWGPDAGARQTARIAGIGRAYHKFPLSFTGGADSQEATLDIVATGKGSFHVGAVSLMPADNVHGWRADMLAALKEIGPTMIRWGGNFVSGYEWRDGTHLPRRNGWNTAMARPPRRWGSSGRRTAIRRLTG